MDDMSGHARPQQDDDQLSPTLTVNAVSLALAAAGVPRSERQIKRYCQLGFLDATKIPGPTGEQWFIAPHAIPKLVGDLQQWQVQRDGRSRPRPAMTQEGTGEIPIVSNPATAGHDLPRPAMSEVGDREKSPPPTQPDTPDYIRQLQKRLDEKDDVIGVLKTQLTSKDQQLSDMSARFTSLSDRFADTQKLMGAMQRMIAPLLGQSDPYDTPQKREVSGVDNPNLAHL